VIVRSMYAKLPICDTCLCPVRVACKVRIACQVCVTRQVCVACQVCVARCPLCEARHSGVLSELYYGGTVYSQVLSELWALWAYCVLTGTLR
jgi:hypothetical protein